MQVPNTWWINSLLQIWFLMTGRICIISSHTMQRFWENQNKANLNRLALKILKEGFGNVKVIKRREKKETRKKSTTGSRSNYKDSCSSFPNTFRNTKKRIHFPYGRRTEYKSFHFVSTTQLSLTRSQPKYLKWSGRTRHRQIDQKNPNQPKLKEL